MKKDNNLQQIRMKILTTIVSVARNKMKLDDVEKAFEDLTLKKEFKYSEQTQKEAFKQMFYLSLGFNLEDESEKKLVF